MAKRHATTLQRSVSGVPCGLAKTRELCGFCAFTSLRYSDMAALKRIDIAEKTKADAMKLIENAWDR